MKASEVSFHTLNLVERIGQATSIEDVYDRVLDFRAAFDVKHAVYHSVNADGRPFALTSYGVEWSKHYEENRLYRMDPVVRAAFTSFAPYDWGHLSWNGKGLRNFRAAAIEGGVGNNGLSLPIRGPDGEFALVSLSNSVSDTTWLTQAEELRPYLVLVGHYLHEVTRGLSSPDKTQQPVALSPREKDVLLFLSRGLNRSAIADKLMISEHTLRVYIDSARRKLDARNTVHAVARALYSGQILN
ncbi:MAG: LuxR family transcriptional regulator [Pseudomonadota bacterium]